MLNKLRKSDEKGFTIIEVMIVLAIAGLILLIVFLAVPALQRSSRNTQRKNDVAQVDSSISNYVSNNNGTLPTSQVLLQTADQDAKLGYYASGAPANGVGVFYGANTAIPTGTPAVGGTTGSASVLTTENVIFISGAECSGNTATTTGASPRSFVLLYAIESGSVGVEQCLGS